MLLLCGVDVALQSDPPTTSLLTRTKQHCLMGIRGTVRRSTDSWFVHCNVGMALSCRKIAHSTHPLNRH